MGGPAGLSSLFLIPNGRLLFQHYVFGLTGRPALLKLFHHHCVSLFVFTRRSAFPPSHIRAMSGMRMADPHTEDGAFGAGVEAGWLGVGWVVRVG